MAEFSAIFSLFSSF